MTGFNYTNGAYPHASLIADANGDLFGTTNSGGSSNLGTVFRITGSGFVPPLSFAGNPGSANCRGASASALSQTYGSTAAAAKALGYSSVSALQAAIAAYCGN